MRPSTLRKLLVTFVSLVLSVPAGFQAGAAQEHLRKLKGPQIRAEVAGMQISDEVHWRDVYELGGTLRSYSMGRTRIGKWSVQGDELCLNLKPPDGACYEVWRSGKNVELRPTGAGPPMEGIIEMPTDRN